MESGSCFQIADSLRESAVGVSMSGFQLNLKQSLIDEDRKRRNRTIDPSEAPQTALRGDK
jgi:hypothetical protein